MNELTIINKNGQLVTDSREVADMIGKRHSDLLESIDGFIKHLTNGNFRSLDFFIPSTYKDNKGEERPCYLLTRKGCDMVGVRHPDLFEKNSLIERKFPPSRIICHKGDKLSLHK